MMRVRGIRNCYVIIMVMIQIVSWFCATSRPIANFNHVSFHPEIINPQTAQEYNSMRSILKLKEDKEIREIEKGRIIGSKPPTCEKKCYGCEPCEAIQVPTISPIPHLSPHYANYQPECWRCHCPP